MALNPTGKDRARVDAWRAKNSFDMDCLSLSDEEVLKILNGDIKKDSSRETDKNSKLNNAKKNSFSYKYFEEFLDWNSDKSKALDAVKTFLNGNEFNFSNICEVSNFDLQALSTAERRQIVFLEHMDFNVLPASTQILTSVLVRLEKVLGDKLSKGSMNNYVYSDTLRELQSLQCDVSIGFGSNLEQRMSELDSDVYAVEVMRTEQARLGIPERFNRVLELLRDEYYSDSKPMFLQTIALPVSMKIPPQLRLFKSSHFLMLISREF